MVDTMRNTDITNWNTINDLLKLPPEDDARTPDLRMLINPELLKMNAGYDPASRLIKIASNRKTTIAHGCSKREAVKILPVMPLKTGNRSMLVTTANTSAIKVSKNDSPMNWRNNSFFP